ncbi:MAG: hypothetical protein ACRCUF_05260, partial [Aeromonas sobria]
SILTDGSSGLAAAGWITLQKRESYGCDLNHKCAGIVQKNLNRAKSGEPAGKGDDRESGKRREQRGVIGMGVRVRVRLRPIHAAQNNQARKGPD